MALQKFLSPSVGELSRRVTFRQRALDANQDRLGPFSDIVSRAARVQPLRGGEAVQSARLEGQQPVVIYVRRDATTKTIDNSFQAVDARDPTIVWDITSAIISEDLNWVEVLATQHLGGDES